MALEISSEDSIATRAGIIANVGNKEKFSCDSNKNFRSLVTDTLLPTETRGQSKLRFMLTNLCTRRIPYSLPIAYKMASLNPKENSSAD